MPPDIRSYLEVRTASPSGFSPDGSRLLVASDLPGSAQLFRTDRDGPARGRAVGELHQLTDLPEPVGGGYLPTEDRLLVTMDAGGNERHQLYLLDDEVPAPARAEEDLDPLVHDPEHIHRPGGVSRDGRLLAYASNRRNGTDFDVHVRDLVSGEEPEAHELGGWTYGAGFSPDGAWLAIGQLTQRPGDNRLHLVERTTGRHVELTPHDEEGHVGAPSWLPDASAFYFATDVDRQHAGIARGTPDGAWAYVFEPGWDADCAIDWAGRHLLVVVNADGYTRATLHDPVTLQTRGEVPLPGPGVAGGFQLSRDGRYVAYGFSSGRVPGDGWLFDTETGELRRLTVSPGDVDPATLVEPDLDRFASFDGERIPVYVFRPREPARGRRPVVAVLHGGPESQYRPSFGPLTQYLVARGFAVVAPNIRGSTGYGKRYEHLDDVEHRFDALRDLEALHDWIAGTDDLDPDRVALYGGSYGGYLVLAGLAFQPDRWAAGAEVVGISNLVTFLRNTADWRRAFREREYGSLDRDHDLLVELSPITHLDAMRAPLFIVHGANDPRVPLGEAEQIHQALRDKGVRSELLVYRDEGHGLAKLSNRLDAYPQLADFLGTVLSA